MSNVIMISCDSINLCVKMCHKLGAFLQLAPLRIIHIWFDHAFHVSCLFRSYIHVVALKLCTICLMWSWFHVIRWYLVISCHFNLESKMLFGHFMWLHMWIVYRCDLFHVSYGTFSLFWSNQFGRCESFYVFTWKWFNIMWSLFKYNFLN